MNHYDSGQMARLLYPMNYVLTDKIGEADLIILNTCSIRKKAEQKAFSFLGRLSGLKKQKPDLIIAVGGCVAQQEGKRFLERVHSLDLVFGTDAVVRLPQLIKRVARGERPIVDVDTNTGDIDELPVTCSIPLSTRATAFVTIMKGCNNHCTYCVVPYVRGSEVSRHHQSIIKEVRSLVDEGVREVTLLGQNVNSYGVKKGGGCDFPELLRRVNDIEGLMRIRFTTSHPRDVSEGLIRSFGTLKKLVPHVHLPIQSGSNRVLKRMNRGYTREFYLEKVERLREIRPDIAITSDIIVGFPGEKDVDFMETLDLIRTVGFDGLFIFKYSDRRLAPASKFPDKVSEEVKQERLSELLELQSSITLEKNRALVGTVQPVLVEGPSKRSEMEWTGRTPCNRVVNFTAPTDVTVGQLVLVEIERAFSHSLKGRVGKNNSVWRHAREGVSYVV